MTHSDAPCSPSPIRGEGLTHAELTRIADWARSHGLIPESDLAENGAQFMALVAPAAWGQRGAELVGLHVTRHENRVVAVRGEEALASGHGVEEALIALAARLPLHARQEG